MPKITKDLKPGDEKRRITSVASEERFSLIDYLPFGRAEAEIRGRWQDELGRLDEQLRDGETVIRLDRGLPRDLWLLLLLEVGNLAGGPKKLERVFAGENRVVLRKSHRANVNIFAGDSAKPLGRVPADDFLSRYVWLGISMCWVMACAGITVAQTVELLRSELRLTVGGSLPEGSTTLERAAAIAETVWGPVMSHMYPVCERLDTDWEEAAKTATVKSSANGIMGPVIRLDRELPRSLWSVMLFGAVSELKRFRNDEQSATAFAEWLRESRSVRLGQLGMGPGGRIPFTVILGMDDELPDRSDWSRAFVGAPPQVFTTEILAESFVWLAFMLGVEADFLAEELRSFPEPSGQ